MMRRHARCEAEHHPNFSSFAVSTTVDGCKQNKKSTSLRVRSETFQTLFVQQLLFHATTHDYMCEHIYARVITLAAPESYTIYKVCAKANYCDHFSLRAHACTLQKLDRARCCVCLVLEFCPNTKEVYTKPARKLRASTGVRKWLKCMRSQTWSGSKL